MACSIGDKTATAYGLIFTPDGKALSFEPSGTTWYNVEYAAEGSGSTIALGALAHGATAVEAVTAAIKHDCYSQGPLTILRMKGK